MTNPRALKPLCEAGAAKPLADEASVEAIGNAISDNIATTVDIAASEAAIRADIDRVENTLRAEIAGG